MPTPPSWFPATAVTTRKLARQRGLEDFPPIYDDRGRVLLTQEPGVPPRPRERQEARRTILEALGSRATVVDGGWSLDARRCRRCESMVLPLVSEQVFLHLEQFSGALESAVRSGAVTFDDDPWQRLALKHLEELEPLCISRQQWWGNEVPDDTDEVFSSWFSLIAWSVAATGWPEQREVQPVDEVFVNPDLLVRWIVPSQLVALKLFGRPAFRRIAVHGALHIVDRDLVELPEASPEAPDEERFLFRSILRPMRKQLGNVVEPATLVRRFGADALRLGLLLCTGSGRPEVVTLSESELRRARRTLHRLLAQFSGLLRLSRDAAAPEPSEADRHVVDQIAAAATEATGAYRDLRLVDAARSLVSAVEELRAFGRRSARGNAGAGAAPGVHRPTLGELVEHLSRGFAPICPHVFSKLRQWAEEHELVSGSRGNREVSSHGPAGAPPRTGKALEERHLDRHALGGGSLD